MAWVVETPPRAWGRLQIVPVFTGFDRNTPTSVGKTDKIDRVNSARQKHPHERGEDITIKFCGGGG